MPYDEEAYQNNHEQVKHKEKVFTLMCKGKTDFLYKGKCNPRTKRAKWNLIKTFIKDSAI